MKIIHSSKASIADWHYLTDCLCGTRVELDIDDFRYVHDSHDGDAAIWKCPDCDRENWINIQLFPPTVQNALGVR